jgi:hypothetical protein
MYRTFSNVKSNTYTTGVDVTKTHECATEGNQCLFLTGTNYMPFAYVSYGGDGYADPSFIVPEFFSYAYSFDKDDLVPYPAVRCYDYYS